LDGAVVPRGHGVMETEEVDGAAWAKQAAAELGKVSMKRMLASPPPPSSLATVPVAAGASTEYPGKKCPAKLAVTDVRSGLNHAAQFDCACLCSTTRLLHDEHNTINHEASGRSTRQRAHSKGPHLLAALGETLCARSRRKRRVPTSSPA
jgi:hypothetical protein